MSDPMTASAERVFVRKSNVEEAPLAGELMLFDASSSRFFVLNPTMAFIWRHCDGRHTVGEMRDALQQAFSDVGETTAGADIEKALVEIVALGLAAENPSAQPATA